MRRTARASFGIAVTIAIALLFLPQMRDILAAFSDYRWNDIPSALLYHASLAFLAFSAWFWSRTVLSARFEVGPSPAERRGIKGKTSTLGHRIDTDAFDFLPRFLFLAVALSGFLAAIRMADLLAALFQFEWKGLLIVLKSCDWIDAAITLLWTAVGYVLLQRRLARAERRGRPNPPSQTIAGAA